MSIFSQLFGRAGQPDRPFVEYPDGELKSVRAALEHGFRVYRKVGAGRRAVISWQGQGGRVDSYDILDVSLIGDTVSFPAGRIDLERACSAEGYAFDALRGPTATDLSIAALSAEEAAAVVEALLKRHVGMKPFQDSREFCVGFEYDRKA